MAFKTTKKSTKNTSSKYPVNSHLVDLITPIGIEFNKTNFWFGDQICRIILVTNYPPKAKIGWLSKVANMQGVICSIHVQPTNSAKLIESINKSMGELQARINSGGSRLMIKRAEQQYEDAESLLEKIDRYQEKIYYVAVSIMITANDKDELEQKSRRVEAVLAGQRMRGRRALFRQEQGLLAVSPYGILPQEIKDIANRNMPVSTIAGAYPFKSTGINDGQGFIFGTDSDDGIILIDCWKRGGDRTNANWVVLGIPGVGKSASVKKVALCEYALGTKIIIIDPEREYYDLCKNVNGQWIDCGGGLGGRINPLQMKEVPLDDEEEEDVKLYRDEGRGIGALALHFQTLRTFFRLYLRSLDDIDEALLEELLEELYLSRGITWDTDISAISNDQYPIMEDLYKLAKEKAEDETVKPNRRERFDKLALLLRRAATGADSALWNGHTTIEPQSNFIVLDTHNLQEADDVIKRTQYFNILTWVWHQVVQNKTDRILVIVDEGYLVIDPEVPQAIQFVRNTSKRIRKYMGGLMFISHSVVDFNHESVRKYGQAILDNAAFKFFMGTDGQNLKELTQLMDLTEAEQDLLAKKKRGHGLLMVGSKRIHARVELSDFEIEMFGKGGGN